MKYLPAGFNTMADKNIADATLSAASVVKITISHVDNVTWPINIQSTRREIMHGQKIHEALNT